MRRLDERKNRLTTGLGTPARSLRRRPDDGVEPWNHERDQGEGQGKERGRRSRQTSAGSSSGDTKQV